MDTLVNDAGPELETPATALRKTSSKLLVLGILGLAALVAAAVWGVQWWTVGRFIETTDDAYLQADSMTVAPKVSGYVTEVYVQDNESVTAGQPLMRLDSRLYQAVLGQATATIAARKADVARGQAEILQQQANIAQARAPAQVTRYEPLAATGAETEERLAELRNAGNQARATLAANTAALQASERQIVATRAQILQAQAQLEAATENTRQAQLDLQDTVVRSTLDGRIGDRAVRVGQYVQPGTRLMTIVPLQDIYLTANFKETQIGLMRSGQPVAIRVDALPGIELHGAVASFAPGTGSQFALLPTENASGNFTKIVQRVPVRIRIDANRETHDRLLPGLSVSVRVDTRGGREDERRLDGKNPLG
jgi:membrane fusion protein, multidrug efflux system